MFYKVDKEKEGLDIYCKRAKDEYVKYIQNIHILKYEFFTWDTII